MSSLSQFNPAFGASNTRYLIDESDTIDGYIKCDGSIVSQSTYSSLYNKLGVIIDGNLYYNTWTRRTTGISAAQSLRDVIYTSDTGLYVCCGGSGGSIFTSTDAITWTVRTSMSTSELLSIVYGAGLYVAVGLSNNLVTSTDAITWTRRSASAPGSIEGITYGDGIYVASGSLGFVATSTDAITWTVRTPGTGGTVRNVVYGNSLYLANGTNGFMATSTNAITWTQRTTNSPASNNFTGAAYVNNEYLMCDTLGALFTSTDAITWIAINSGTNSVIRSVTYEDGLYFYCGDGGLLATSTDAVTWTFRSPDTTSTINALAYSAADDLYVYAGSNQTLGTAIKYTYDTTTEFILPGYNNKQQLVTTSVLIKNPDIYIKSE